MMINPWLSDPSGEHLDQPTELYTMILFIGDQAHPLDVYFYLQVARVKLIGPSYDPVEDW